MPILLNTPMSYLPFWQTFFIFSSSKIDLKIFTKFSTAILSSNFLEKRLTLFLRGFSGIKKPSPAFVEKETPAIFRSK